MRHFAVQSNGSIPMHYTRVQCERFADVCRRASSAALSLAIKAVEQAQAAPPWTQQTLPQALMTTARKLKQTADAWERDAQTLQAAALQPTRTPLRPLPTYRPLTYHYDLTRPILEVAAA